MERITIVLFCYWMKKQIFFLLITSALMSSRYLKPFFFRHSPASRQDIQSVVRNPKWHFTPEDGADGLRKKIPQGQKMVFADCPS